jgi:hypothetical protein
MQPSTSKDADSLDALTLKDIGDEFLAMRLRSPFTVPPLFLPKTAPDARVRQREAFNIVWQSHRRLPSRRYADVDALSDIDVVTSSVALSDLEFR